MMKRMKKNKGKILIGIIVIIISIMVCLGYSENKKNAKLQEFSRYLTCYKEEISQYILEGKEEQYHSLLDTSQLAIEKDNCDEISNLKSELESLKVIIIEQNLELVTNNFNELNNMDISALMDERKIIISSIKSEIDQLIIEKKYKEANEKLLKLKNEINNEIEELNKVKNALEKTRKVEEEKENATKQEVIQESNKAATGSYVSNLKVANETDQLLIVKGTGGSNATIEYHVKDGNGIWNEVFSTWGYVGQSGITYNKVEGDRKTPAGAYSFGTAFGIKSNPGTSISYNILNNNDYWVDDSNSKYYNKWVRGDTIDKDWNSAEHMIEFKEAYKYGIVINYNTYNTIPGKGSAIFLHCTTKPTPGCVSIPENYMIKLLQQISSSARIVIAANKNDIYNY